MFKQILSRVLETFFSPFRLFNLSIRAFCLTGLMLLQFHAIVTAQLQPEKLRKLSRELLQEDKKSDARKVFFPAGFLSGRDVAPVWVNGFPVLREQADANANATHGSIHVVSGGRALLQLSGSSEIIGLWDAGKPRLTHQEFGGRVSKTDTAAVADNSHATQVAGVAMASGVSSSAKGMAPSALVQSYDWINDAAEMAYAASNGLKISVHPYAETSGWVFNLFNDNRWVWYTDTVFSSTQNRSFGFYGSMASTWDNIAALAPDYLIVKAAGNLRGRGPASQPVLHWIPYLENDTWHWKTVTTIREINGGSSGFETLTHSSVSKNVLVVASVQTIPGGYTGPGDVVAASSSGTGPTDDGRIKPDISAAGVNLYAPISSSNSSYATGSGTSFAAGVVAGAAALIRQHYQNRTGKSASAAMVKTILLHTAREAGSDPGPDYVYGWGLLDVERAVRFASAAFNNAPGVFLADTVISQGQTLTFSGKTFGNAPLKVTVVWTDPAHDALPDGIDPTTSVLVNDLDVRVDDGTVHFPWKLSRSNPSAAATRNTDNATDNVEIVEVDNPEPDFTVSITHKGTLTGATQRFSIFITSGNPASEAVLSGSAGWRLLSWPTEASWQLIHHQLPVQGINGAPGGENFPANVYYTYTGSTWQKPASFLDSPAAGTGFLHYVFNNTQNGSRTLPITLGAAGTTRWNDVTVSLHTTGDLFNMVGNPFDAAIDFSSVTSNGSIQADGHLWDAAFGWRLTSEVGDSIGAFQGFFIENNTATTLTIPQAARIAGGRLLKEKPISGFKIRLVTSDGLQNPDQGFSIVFYPEATLGYDLWDARKLWPLSSPYAALAADAGFGNAARVSLPEGLSHPVELDVVVRNSGVSSAVSVKVETLGEPPFPFHIKWINPEDGEISELVPGTLKPERIPAARKEMSKTPELTSVEPVWRKLRLEPAQTTSITQVVRFDEDLNLYQNYPNPFSGGTMIHFKMREQDFVTLRVYDLSGRLVHTALEQIMGPGGHSKAIVPNGWAPGIYMLVLQNSKQRLMKRMTVLPSTR